MRVLISILLLICFVSLCGCGPVTPVSREGDNRSTVSSAFCVSMEIIIKPDEICYFDIVENNCVYCFADGTVCVLDLNTGKIKSSFTVERCRYDEDSNTVDRLQFYDEHQQFFQISNASMPVLAVYGGELEKGGDVYGLIDFYDLYLGKKLRTLRIKNNFEIRGLGSSDDGKLFYFVDFFSCSFYCVDIKSGDIIWIRLLDDIYSNAYMRADGKSFVIFPHDRTAAFNKDGDELWRVKTKEDCWVLPTLQPLEPSDVVLVYPEDQEKDYWIAAMSLQDGSIMWRKPGIEVESVRSATKDRKKQAIYMNGNMCVSHYPEDKIIKIPKIKEICDAVFSQDGNTLFCLPQLQWIYGERKLAINWFDIKISNDGNTLFRLPYPQMIDTYAIKCLRNSHILTMVDCSTGKITKQIKLIKPVIK